MCGVFGEINSTSPLTPLRWRGEAPLADGITTFPGIEWHISPFALFLKKIE